MLGSSLEDFSTYRADDGVSFQANLHLVQSWLLKLPMMHPALHVDIGGALRPLHRIRDLIVQMLQHDPGERPTAAALKGYFPGQHCCHGQPLSFEISA